MSTHTKSLSIWLSLFLSAAFPVVPGLAQMPEERSSQQLRELAEIRPLSADISESLSPGKVEPKTYGTLDQTCLNIPAAAFSPFNSSTTYDTNGSGHRWRTGGSSALDAPVQLPSGAIVGRLELDFFDNNAGLDVRAFLSRCDYTGGAPCDFFPPAGIASSGTPGHSSVSTDLTPSNIVIANYYKQYWVRIAQFTVDSSTMFKGMIVCYKLQVSPAPGTATFLDVPTSHPFFRFIEALASAGITSGCGGGNYCPDDPITRGQMAVFISRALGLHWPN